jgi:hypothetical protein
MHSGRNVYLRSAPFWDFTQRRIPKERRSYLHRGGSLKSRKMHKVSEQVAVCIFRAKNSHVKIVYNTRNETGRRNCISYTAFPLALFFYRKHVAVSQKV